MIHPDGNDPEVKSADSPDQDQDQDDLDPGSPSIAIPWTIHFSTARSMVPLQPPERLRTRIPIMVYCSSSVATSALSPQSRCVKPTPPAIPLF